MLRSEHFIMIGIHAACFFLFLENFYSFGLTFKRNGFFAFP